MTSLMMKLSLTVLLAGILAGALPRGVVGQNCGCSAPNNVSVADIVTEEFFNGIINQAAACCEGKKFYTRERFLTAIGSFPQFGRMGSEDDSKREIAAFFAHVTHETGYLCSINERNGALKDYCDTFNNQYPCVAGKAYYGRGPIQLKWNFNYGLAGNAIGFDGLNLPETVATDPIMSFKTALWYWVNFVEPVMCQGFGATIQAINCAFECKERNPPVVRARVGFYVNYCNQFHVTPGDNLYC